MQIQPGDTPLPVFSFMGHVKDHPEQIPCHITHTNESTHDFIRGGLKDSPMFTGNIEGVGQDIVRPLKIRWFASLREILIKFLLSLRV